MAPNDALGHTGMPKATQNENSTHFKESVAMEQNVRTKTRNCEQKKQKAWKNACCESFQ